MPDLAVNPTVSFAQKLNDPTKWVRVSSVPYFDAHVEQYTEPVLGADGKPVKDPTTGQPQMVQRQEVFDRAALERHAANCNNLVASGNPPGLVIGHTLDKGPETAQPETAGWAVNFRVGHHPTLGRDVIYADELYDPKEFERLQVKTFPYRSVERWKAGQYFKPIALLRREPRRNLGVVAYHQAHDICIRYSMENTMPDMPPPGAGPATPPAAGGGAPPPMPGAGGMPSMEPSDQDKDIFAKLCKYFKVNYADPSAGMGAPPMPAAPPSPPAAPAPAAPPAVQNAACPSGSNTAMPAPILNEAATEGEVDRYQKELNDARDRIASLEKDARMTRYAAALGDLRRDYQFDVPEELAEVQNHSQEAFEKHCKKIRERYQRMPRDASGPIRLASLDSPMESDRDSFSREDMESALKYQAAHPGTEWATARDHVIKEKKTGGAAKTA